MKSFTTVTRAMHAYYYSVMLCDVMLLNMIIILFDNQDRKEFWNREVCVMNKNIKLISNNFKEILQGTRFVVLI